jgi:hypothetical protein
MRDGLPSLPEGRNCVSRPPTPNVIVRFRVPMPKVGVVGWLSAVGTIRTLPLGRVFIITRVSAHTGEITRRAASYGSTFAASALAVTTLDDSALYRQLLPGSD